MLDILLNDPNPNPEILFRAGFLNSLGYKFDIPWLRREDVRDLSKTIGRRPFQPACQLHVWKISSWGKKTKRGYPLPRKALEADVGDAAYALGMTHLSLGDKQKALENLEDYRKRRPNDENTAKIIDAICNGTIEFKMN